MLPLERRAFGTPACFCETGREGESLLYSRLQHAYLELWRCDFGVWLMGEGRRLYFPSFE